jgi:hypothetical protein
MSRLTGIDLTRLYDKPEYTLGSYYEENGIKYKFVKLTESNTYWYGAPLVINEKNEAFPVTADSGTYASVNIDAIMPYLGNEMSVGTVTYFVNDTLYKVALGTTAKYCWVAVNGIVDGVVAGSILGITGITYGSSPTAVSKEKLAPTTFASISAVFRYMTSLTTYTNVYYLGYGGTTGITIASGRLAKIKIVN